MYIYIYIHNVLLTQPRTLLENSTVSSLQKKQPVTLDQQPALPRPSQIGTIFEPLNIQNHKGVSINTGTPKSSILIGCSIINHSFWGFPPIFGNTHIMILGPPILGGHNGSPLLPFSLLWASCICLEVLSLEH